LWIPKFLQTYYKLTKEKNEQFAKMSKMQQ
jgi:hypothetical protein